MRITIKFYILLLLSRYYYINLIYLYIDEHFKELKKVKRNEKEPTNRLKYQMKVVNNLRKPFIICFIF